MINQQFVKLRVICSCIGFVFTFFMFTIVKRGAKGHIISIVELQKLLKAYQAISAKSLIFILRSMSQFHLIHVAGDMMHQIFLNFSFFLFIIKLFNVYFIDLSNSIFINKVYQNLDKFYMNSTMTGITLASTNAKPPLHFDQNISECLMLNDFLPNSVKWCLLCSFLIILFMKLNFLIYFKKVKTNKSKSRYSKNNIMRKLILISTYKILLAGIIYFALKNPATKPKQFSVDECRLSNQAYFLSPEYYRDIYKINEQYTKHLLKWQCLSKLKLNSFEKFYQTLLLLSGDIALNPGPVSYPCSKCSKGVRTSAVLCTNCEMWIHGKCEGISNTAIKSLSNNPTLRSHFVCVVCRNKNNNLDLTEDDPTVAESSFQFQEEHVHDISLDDYSSIFKQKGLHFIHLNCNSLLSKIEELRTFIVSTSPHIICFSETKLDKSISDREIPYYMKCIRHVINTNWTNLY